MNTYSNTLFLFMAHLTIFLYKGLMSHWKIKALFLTRMGFMTYETITFFGWYVHVSIPESGIRRIMARAAQLLALCKEQPFIVGYMPCMACQAFPLLCRRMDHCIFFLHPFQRIFMTKEAETPGGAFQIMLELAAMGIVTG